MTGPIHLNSNVNLHVSDGAVINFFVDPGKYMPVVYSRFEGIECMNYSPLVYAYEQENIAITAGKYRYNRQRNTRRPCKRRKLVAMETYPGR